MRVELLGVLVAISYCAECGRVLGLGWGFRCDNVYGGWMKMRMG